MENSQKDKQRKILQAVIFAVLCAMILLLCFQVFFLKREMLTANTQLQELKGLISHVDQRLMMILKEGAASDFVEGGEQTLSPSIDVDKPDNSVIKEPEAKHKVYLTFDDGPSKQTEAILDILDEYDVKATFFVVGKEGEEAKERLKMIYERGHTIGMHSYSHDYALIYESQEAFREDFLKCKQYIYDATGVDSYYYRFPGGSSNTLSNLRMEVFADYLHEQGIEYYDWNVSSGDGGGNLMPAENIIKNSLQSISAYDTSIILLHDSASKTTTVEALPQLIESILEIEDTLILPITEGTQAIHHVITPVEDEVITEKVEEHK